MKRSRIREVSMEVTVGAFMFMVLLALGFFTIVLSRENIFRKNYYVQVRFSNVMGLREGDNVFVHGVNVGKIKRLEVTPSGVELTASLDYEPHLHSDYSIQIVPSSVLGGRYLDIDEGSPDKPLVPAGSVLTGQPPVDLIDEAADTIRMIRESLKDGQVLKNLEDTMAHLREITAKVSNGEGTIGKLVNDEKVYDELQQIVANLKDVSERLAQGKGTLGHLLSEDDTFYTNLTAAAASMKVITKRIESGEGTLGKLSKDEDLYVEATRLLHEIRAAVDDYRETAPITTFTSIFFGAF